MESGMPSVSTNMVGRNPTVMDGIALQTVPNSIMQYGSFHQNQTLSRYTALSTLQGEPTSGDITSSQFAKPTAAIDSDMLVTSLERDVMRMPGSLPAVANSELQDHFVGGTPISSAALATLLATESSLQENLNNLAFAGSAVSPLEVLKPHDWGDSFASTVNYDCYEVFGSLNGKEDSDRFPIPLGIGGKFPASAVFQRYSSIGNLEPNSWILNGVNVSADNTRNSSRFSNELSLSLTTSQPSIINVTSITDQCSEISSSDVAHRCLKGTSLCSEQGSYNYKELSLSCDSSKAGQFSQVILESRYLRVIQDILSQIARYSLENLDQMSFSSCGLKSATSLPFSLDCPIGGRLASVGSEDSSTEGSMFHFQMDPALQKRALEAKKTQLLTLLRLVDDQYNQCLDEIHTVISAFHAATELDPQIHTRFALQTITFLYKSLRERISNKILSIGAHFDTGFPRETEGCFDSYFQKQWTLQQLKKKDQLWRPQRGLPERSVSVLRTWMFQNFLHPYPKDADKHLLAVKSGLTRSQVHKCYVVSNWFINARVRLWKPMIEEMYAEMNRRKARHGEDGTNGSLRSHIGILSASQDSLANQS